MYAIRSYYVFDVFYAHVYLFIAIMMVFAVGIYDDRHETHHRMKFVVLILASLLLYPEGLLISDSGKCCGMQA